MSASTASIITELLTLRGENRRLRYRVDLAAAERERVRVERAFHDASILVGQHFAWQPTSRRQSPLSERRWAAAVAALRLARLVPQRGRAALRCDSPVLAAARLETARAVALDDPGALWLRLPLTRRRR